MALAPVLRSPGETKWLISQLDWFCGTRMHATIAALSSGVPVSAIAYSAKVQGVFETCGQGDAVADARTLPGPDVVEVVWASFAGRRAAAEALAAPRRRARPGRRPDGRHRRRLRRPPGLDPRPGGCVTGRARE